MYLGITRRPNCTTVLHGDSLESRALILADVVAMHEFRTRPCLYFTESRSAAVFTMSEAGVQSPSAFPA